MGSCSLSRAVNPGREMLLRKISKRPHNWKAASYLSQQLPSVLVLWNLPMTSRSLRPLTVRVKLVPLLDCGASEPKRPRKLKLMTFQHQERSNNVVLEIKKKYLKLSK